MQVDYFGFILNYVEIWVGDEFPRIKSGHKLTPTLSFWIFLDLWRGGVVQQLVVLRAYY